MSHRWVVVLPCVGEVDDHSQLAAVVSQDAQVELRVVLLQ